MRAISRREVSVVMKESRKVVKIGSGTGFFNVFLMRVVM